MPGLDTQVLFAFNPKDRHHSRAIKLLKDIQTRRIRDVYVTAVALLEFVVVMKSKGYTNQQIKKALLALQRILVQYGIQYKKTLNTSIFIDALSFMDWGASFFDALLAASIKSINNMIVSSDKIYEKINITRYEF